MAEVDTIVVLDANGVQREVPTLLSVEAMLDGLETLITSTNTKLDTVITSLQLIDNVTQTTSAPTGADTAWVVGIHPDSQNANGRAAAADSAPTVMSTEDLAVLTAVETATELIDDAIVADDAAFTPATTKVMMAGYFADEASTDSVTEGDGGAARMTLDRKQITTNQPHSAGGLSVFRSLDLDETEEDIKTSAGCLYKLRITNRTTSVRYVKLYNDTAANVIVGTTAPVDTIPIPANASDYTVLTESFGGLGLEFSAAISIACTTGFADNDTGAPGANDVIVSAYYK
jgi:hypothetical protein